ncbi:hypothetical protein PanWU01x14_136830, partial [Parasponia andersonii]
MTTFDSGIMGLRYIYFDDLCDETNPTGLVRGRMVAEIGGGGQKSEMATLELFGIAGDGGDRGRAARLRRRTRRLRRSVAWADDGGGGSCSGPALSAERSPEGERERERE